MKTQNELETNLQDILTKINKCTKQMAKAIMNDNKEHIEYFVYQINQLDAKKKVLQSVLN